MRTFALFHRHAGHIERGAGDLAQEGQAVVEFMIADRAGVVADCVHGLVDRQFLIARQRFDLRLPVGQRRALDRIAGIEGQAVFEFLARRADQFGRALETEIAVLGELEVIVAHDVGMDVGRFQNADPRARACSRRSLMCAVRLLHRAGGKGKAGKAGGQEQLDSMHCDDPFQGSRKFSASATLRFVAFLHVAKGKPGWHLLT